jgi:uncharacterized transporter YbjL
MSVYMLVDGILYHAIPLIFVALMCAYLFSLRLDETGGGRASMLTDSPSVSGPQKLS